MIFITYKVLNLVRSARNRLRPVWITFGIVLSVFQHYKRFRYKFFDIVQFSRSWAPQPRGWQLNYFITFVIVCQALFFGSLETFWRTWDDPQWSYSLCFLAVGSHSFRRPLALKYNTTLPPLWQALFAFLRDVCGIVQFLSPFSGGFCPFPLVKDIVGYLKMCHSILPIKR